MVRRTLIIGSLILALAATAAMAQGRRVERLQQRFGMSDAQISSIRTLAQERRKEMKSLRQDLRTGSLTQQDAQEKRREINQRFKSGVKDLLTPDQLQKLPKRQRK